VQFQTDDELARLAGDIGTTIFHPVGTCRMGIAGDDRRRWSTRAACARRGNLRIADASVMPTITSGNTNAPTLMMIAERAAPNGRLGRPSRRVVARKAACGVANPRRVFNPAAVCALPAAFLTRNATPCRSVNRP
jgi:hypothetical protein